MFAGYEAMRALFVSTTRGKGRGGTEEEAAAKTNARRNDVNHTITIEKLGVIRLKLTDRHS